MRRLRTINLNHKVYQCFLAVCQITINLAAYKSAYLFSQSFHEVGVPCN